MMISTLNPLTIPSSGTHLIEASAGTGKTWSIAALYARLVILERIDVTQILVVTFTKAATAELKNRLRDRLDDALLALQQTPNAAKNLDQLNQQCSDDFLFQLLQQALQQDTQERLQLRLKAAISHFDHAAIFTIHGFCQRVLRDFAFYCEMPFQLELDENPNPTYRLNTAQDFWRKEVAQQPENAALVYRHKLTPQDVANHLSNFLARPTLHTRQPEPSILANVKQTFMETWQNLSLKLPEIETAFWQQHPQLNGNSFQAKTLANRFEQLKIFSGSPDDASSLVMTLSNSNGICYFDANFLNEKTKKGKSLNPDDVAKISQLNTLFQAAQNWENAQSNHLIQLQLNLLQYLRTQHEQRKKEQPERSFDDMLLDLYQALQDDKTHARTLAKMLASNWRIALIDEFQDTDPLQYAIFQRTFGIAAKNASGNEPQALFMVGDPKQAIYSFRGADIFAYLQAADGVQQRHTLNTNHRSYAKLINSISALFKNRSQPFALDKIAYTDIQAADKNQQSRLVPQQASFVVRYLENALPEHQDKQRGAAQYCAQEIANLLHSEQKILDKQGQAKAIEAGQIAVLVRNHYQGKLMQNALKNQNIQSVLLGRDSVFAQEEALSLLSLMNFILQPLNHSFLTYVLSGCLFDYSADDLAQMQHNDALLQWTDLATQSLQTWQKHGIYAALQTIFTTHQVEQNLLKQRRERTLTNLYQLLELLANAEQQINNPSALLQWLQTQIQAAQNNNNQPENSILRLESDENLVKIVTMHASKGLQYPIVFCPFAFQEKKDNPKKSWLTLHEDHQTLLLHKNQLTPKDKEQQQKEHLSEDLRLWYVALTRAEQQLTLYLLDNDKNIFAYLLGYQKNKDNTFAQVWQQFIAQQDPNQTDFYWTDETPQHTVSHTFRQPETPQYTAQEIVFRPQKIIQHTSFTGLTKTKERVVENETAEHNTRIDLEECSEKNQLSGSLSNNDNTIANFPSGAKAGVCLHEILEHYRAEHSHDKQTQLIEKILNKHQFDAKKWTPIIAQMAYNTCQTPLLNQLNIATLPEHARLDEMRFMFHHSDFELKKIQQWLQQQTSLDPIIIQAAQNLSFKDIDGYITGFIDLFMHQANTTIIVDYKSNLLPDYHPNTLNQAIAEHHYYLQALIYTIAVARYLNSRQSPSPVISIRYLFLRGLDGITQQGIWQWDIAWQDLALWL